MTWALDAGRGWGWGAAWGRGVEPGVNSTTARSWGFAVDRVTGSPSSSCGYRAPGPRISSRASHRRGPGTFRDQATPAGPRWGAVGAPHAPPPPHAPDQAAPPHPIGAPAPPPPPRRAPAPRP